VSKGRTVFAHPDEALNRLMALHRTFGTSPGGPGFSRIISYRSTDGEPFENRLSDLLPHMVNHGT